MSNDFFFHLKSSADRCSYVGLSSHRPCIYPSHLGGWMRGGGGQQSVQAFYLRHLLSYKRSRSFMTVMTVWIYMEDNGGDHYRPPSLSIRWHHGVITLPAPNNLVKAWQVRHGPIKVSLCCVLSHSLSPVAMWASISINMRNHCGISHRRAADHSSDDTTNKSASQKTETGPCIHCTVIHPSPGEDVSFIFVFSPDQSKKRKKIWWV